jgi:biopolymer transport protein ExbB
MAGIAQFFIEGGIWMAPIGFLSILVVAVVIERAYYLMMVYNENGPELMAKVRRAVQGNQIDQAIKACDTKPNAALPQVLKKALQNADGSEDDIRNAIEEATMEMVPIVQTRGNTLAGFASLATLLGLLGTVMGLIEAFTVVADAPPDQKSVLLTKAISVAMNCTAFGLMVAIPAMFFQLLVSGSVKKLVDDIDNYSLKLETLLVNRKLRGPDFAMGGAKNERR